MVSILNLGNVGRVSFLALLVCCACIVGCFGGEKIQKAGGTVMVDGKPSSEGTIEFYPVGGGRTANAVIQEDGTFTISYRRPGDGLPPGNYKVAVIVDQVIGDSRQRTTDTGDLSDDGFAPTGTPGKVRHIVPAIYNSVDTTPLTQTIEDNGETQNLIIKISTKK